MPNLPGPLLFDLDGTLADTIDGIAASANHVRVHCGLPPLPVAAIQSYIGDGAAVLMRRGLAELGLAADDARWRELYSVYAEHHEAHCTDSVRLYDGVRSYLERGRARGRALAIVTNKPERFARRIAEHLDLTAFFPVIVGGDTLPQKKPDPAPLRFAVEQLGAADTNGTMIGDGETDIRAGKAIGFRTVGCLFGYRPRERLLAEAADEYWQVFGG